MSVSWPVALAEREGAGGEVRRAEVRAVRGTAVRADTSRRTIAAVMRHGPYEAELDASRTIRMSEANRGGVFLID